MKCLNLILLIAAAVSAKEAAKGNVKGVKMNKGNHTLHPKESKDKGGGAKERGMF